MQLCQKQKTFPSIFAAFSKSIWNFERFEREDDPHSFYISEITNFENMVR